MAHPDCFKNLVQNGVFWLFFNVKQSKNLVSVKI